MSNCIPAKDALPAVYEAFIDAFARRDSSALAALYTVDSQVFPPGSDIISGYDAISGYFDALFELGVKRCSFDTFEIEEHGNIAFETGRVALYAEGDVEIDTLKYMVIWKCEGGNWLVHRDILNSDKPSA